MAKTTLSFTPSEELILEVLQARIRLGENIWTFDSRLKPQLEKLSAKGVVNFKNGVMERTLLAWPTETGKILLFSDEFTPRIPGKKFAKHQKNLRSEAKALKRKRKSNG